MGKAQLTVKETKEMFIYVSNKIMESKDVLTQTDKAIGDGDHGIGMARGFEAVAQKLDTQSFTSIGEIFKSVGMTLMTSIGGAAGAVFGTFFRGAGQNTDDHFELNSQTLAVVLQDGLQAVKDRGKAKPGDKTMVDALEPATVKSTELTAAPLDEALTEITEAARQGMEKTKQMVATLGKAKTLGERSLGHADPGSLSTYLIFKYMLEFVSE
ncbi:MAG: dihydroxyacetone kinase subunit L [Deltaproteobacteria bacterium]|jgi:dihydroxyacetone kinase-like protein|nr:dihydroxyacetone kinase subunit L [Deltaproteobacteria bacterium]